MAGAEGGLIEIKYLPYVKHFFRLSELFMYDNPSWTWLQLPENGPCNLKIIRCQIGRPTLSDTSIEVEGGLTV